MSERPDLVETVSVMADQLTARNAELVKLETQRDALLAACECQDALDRYDEPGTGYTRLQMDAVLNRYGINFETWPACMHAVQAMRRTAIAPAKPEEPSPVIAARVVEAPK